MSIRHIVQSTDPTCEVVVIMNNDGGAEVFIAPHKAAATKVNIVPPDERERIVIKRTPDGCVDIYYEDVEP
jgi:hypothetical protein